MCHCNSSNPKLDRPSTYRRKTDKHTIATRNSASQLIAWPSAIICLSIFSIRFNLRFTCFAEVYYFVLAMQAACLHCYLVIEKLLVPQTIATNRTNVFPGLIIFHERCKIVHQHFDLWICCHKLIHCFIECRSHCLEHFVIKFNNFDTFFFL